MVLVLHSQILRMIQYLINFARPFIYTTALPPHSIISIISAFEHLSQSASAIKQLDTIISLFLEQTKSIPGVSRNQSCIQSVIIPGNEAAKKASLKLQENGLDVRPILSPTVQKGKERLRICLHAYNTESDIMLLTNLLKTII